MNVGTEFREISHCGGQIIFRVTTSAEGQRAYQRLVEDTPENDPQADVAFCQVVCCNLRLCHPDLLWVIFGRILN
jgi:hypothetical protein